MPSSDERRLLDDVLRDANYAAFRAETFELCQAEFNQGRRRPVKGVLFAVAAVVAVSTLLIVTILPGWNRRSNREAVTGNTVSVQKAEGLALIKSMPIIPAETVHSVPDRSLALETAQYSSIERVRSNPSTLVEIQDAELIALFKDDTLGFLRSGERLSLYSPLTSSVFH